MLVAEDSFGPNLGSLTRKMVRKSLLAVRNNFVLLPHDAKEKFRETTTCADFMKINGIPLFVAIFKDTCFRTIECCTSQHMEVHLTCVNNIDRMVRARGFKVTAIEMDGEFEPLQGSAADMGITMNNTSRGEHAHPAERNMRTNKDRIRSALSSLLFK